MRKSTAQVIPMTPEQAEVGRTIVLDTSKIISQVIEPSLKNLALKYEGSAGMPAFDPIMRATLHLPLYVRLSMIGTTGIDNISRINEIVKVSGNEDHDPFSTNLLIRSALKVVGKTYHPLTARINYGLIIGTSEKEPYDKIKVTRKSIADSKGLVAFAGAFPQSYRDMCLQTAKSMEIIYNTAKNQLEKASSVRESFRSEFERKRLLVRYAEEYTKHSTIVKEATKLRTARKELMLKEVDKPNTAMHEGTLAGPTLLLYDSMLGKALAASSYTDRTLAVITSSDAVVGSIITAIGTGIRPLSWANRTGMFVLLHYMRMIFASLLAAAVATHEITQKEYERIQQGFKQEDEAMRLILESENF